MRRINLEKGYHILEGWLEPPVVPEKWRVETNCLHSCAGFQEFRFAQYMNQSVVDVHQTFPSWIQFAGCTVDILGLIRLGRQGELLTSSVNSPSQAFRSNVKTSKIPNTRVDSHIRDGKATISRLRYLAARSRVLAILWEDATRRRFSSTPIFWLRVWSTIFRLIPLIKFLIIWSLEMRWVAEDWRLRLTFSAIASIQLTRATLLFTLSFVKYNGREAGISILERNVSRSCNVRRKIIWPEER